MTIIIIKYTIDVAYEIYVMEKIPSSLKSYRIWSKWYMKAVSSDFN